MPREHGAYAQLALPLLAALAAGRPTLSSLCYAFAACAAFVAHEPVLVVLGQRGTRARRETAARARRWLGASVAILALLGTTAFLLSARSRASIALPAALALASGVFVFRREERSLLGEAVACAALASAAVPTAVAAGLAYGDALVLWTVFVVGFLVATVEVRAVAHHEVNRLARKAVWTGAVAATVATAATRPLLALAPLPILLVVACVVARASSATALRRVGWTLATSSLLTGVVAVVALRAS